MARGHILLKTLLILLPSIPGLATTWSWSLSGSTLPGGSGTMTGCESTTATLVSGSYTIPSTGFVHMTGVTCKNSCNAGCSSCSAVNTSGSCSGLPSDIYAIELAGVHLIVQPVLSSPQETQPSYNIGTGTCPTVSTTTYNFIFSQWSNTNDTTSSGQIAVGTFTWQTNGSVATVASGNNVLSGFGSTSSNFTLPNSGCTSGQIPITGSAGTDRNGNIYITNEGEFFYQSSANHAVFGIPQVTINNSSELTGTYSGFVYDASGTSGEVTPITNMYIGPSGTSMTGYQMTSDTTWNTSFKRTFAFGTSGVNQPVNGMIEGTISDGTSTSNMICATNLGSYNYNQLFCAGQEPAINSTPYNLILIQEPQIDEASLIGNWDAEFGPQSGTTWSDATANNNACTLNTGVTWTGGGTSGSPYAINFSSTNSGANFGSSLLSGETHVMFDLWVSPGTESGEQVFLGDSSDGTGKGFTLRQSKTKNIAIPTAYVGKTYQQIILADSPVAYYRLNETSGTVATDFSTNANNGTYTGGFTLAKTGPIIGDNSSRAALFDGTSGYVSIPEASQVYFNTNGTFSLEAWVNVNSTSGNNQGVMNIGVFKRKYYGLIYRGGGPVWDFSDGTTTLENDNDGPVTPTGSWHYLAGTYSNGTDLIYIDGMEAGGPSSVKASYLGTSGGFTIGRFLGTSGNTSFFNAEIAEVAVYNTTLTPTQVQNHYAAGQALFGSQEELVVGQSYQDVVLSDSPVAYWRLNELHGSYAYDASGNGNTLTYFPDQSDVAAYVNRGTAGALTNDSDPGINLNQGIGALGAAYALSNPSTAVNNFTLEAWVQPSSLSQQALFVYNGQSDGWGFGMAGGVSGCTTGCTVSNGASLFGYYNDSSTPQYLYSGYTFTSTTNWVHLAMVRDSGTTTFYVNGVAQPNTYTLTPTALTSNNFAIGEMYNNGWNFSGSVDEVALYNTALSASRILAHYNAGLGTYGGICYSQSSLAENTWNFLGGLYDGTNATLFVDGRQECQVGAPSGYFTPPATALYAGSTSTGGSPWQGEMTGVQVYGTSDGSGVGSSTNIKSNFDASADRFRSTPVGNIVTNGLVLSLDASNATHGLTFPGAGCSITSWFDLSPSQLDGTLTGFTSCGTYGWQGAGTSSNPYQVVFDGSADYIDLGTTSTLDLAYISVAAWIKPTTYAANVSIYNHRTGSNNSGVTLDESGTGSGLTWFVNVGGSWSSLGLSSLGSATWHYVVATFDGSNQAIYLDGALSGSQSLSGTITSVSSDTQIGRDIANGTSFYSGAMGGIAVYSRGLSANEVSQNCKAQESRFSSTAICN